MFGFGVHKYVLSALSGVCICKGQRLKVINILPLLLSFFFVCSQFFKAGSITETGAQCFNRLAEQWAPWFTHLHLPSVGVTDVCCHIWFYTLCWDPNSVPDVCIAGAFLTEPPP